MDVRYSTNKFLDGAISQDKKHPNFSARQVRHRVA